MSEMEEMESDVGPFRDYLIVKACDPSSGLSVAERALYSLLSVPVAAQKLCTKDELEAVVQTVKAAMQAAIDASLHEGEAER